MTPFSTPPGAPRAYITITIGHWRSVRMERARLGTALLSWWLVVVLVTTPLQYTLHCLLLRGHAAAHHHSAARMSDGSGTGVAYGGDCHIAAPLLHEPTVPAAALHAVPTVLSFLPVSVLLPALLALLGTGAARCRAACAVLLLRASACVCPLVPPPRPVAGLFI